MKSFYTAIICLFVGLNLVACSSTGENPANEKPVSNRATTAVAANTANPGDGVNKETAAGTYEEPTSDQTPLGKRQAKMEAMRREAENSPPPKIDIEAEIKKSTIPAPENSEFGAVLADGVFERRTFKSHPQLLKVEKTTKGGGKSIKVYLKDGKVIDVPGEKIEFISKATSASILHAAGLGTPAETRKPNSKPIDR